MHPGLQIEVHVATENGNSHGVELGLPARGLADVGIVRGCCLHI